MNFDLQILAQQAGEGAAYWFLDALSIVKLSSAQTGGAFALIEDHFPAGRATPYHVHRHEDEAFYLLEGEFTFFSGTRKFTGTAGTTVFLPRNIPHGFRADTAGKMLLLTVPGGFDSFVAEAGEPAATRTIPTPKPPDFARLTTLAAKYQIEILGPLPE
jgi:quercetin dioxygenase-like cupin family protein